MQLATIETTQQIVPAETKTNESDTLVEENEEAILLEDGILLMYVEKQSCTNEETKTTKVQRTSKVEVPECNADNWTQVPRDYYETSEKSQKSQAESIDFTPSTSQPTVNINETTTKETFEEQPSRINVSDKLIKVANNLGNEIMNEENIKIPAIDLLLRIQAALDEQQIFLENTTINILEIINRILDKSALAWWEKLSGQTFNSRQAKALADSLSKDSKAKEQEKKKTKKRCLHYAKMCRDFTKCCQDL